MRRWRLLRRKRRKEGGEGRIDESWLNRRRAGWASRKS